MALEKTEIHTAEVDEYGVVFHITRTIIRDNGVDIATNTHRHPVRPGDDFSAKPKAIRDICMAAHTPEALAVRAARIELSTARANEMGQNIIAEKEQALVNAEAALRQQREQ